MIPIPRPTPGQVTEREFVVDVCGECGYVIENGLCDYECPYDGDLAKRPKIIHAVYKRTDVFVRDDVEETHQNSLSEL
jgi:hypothetical protein